MVKHKHADVIHAWADGAEIEFKNGTQWVDCEDNDPDWNPTTEYRVKPEKVYPKSTLTDDELNDLYHTEKLGFTIRLREIADAAVKRYIQEQEAKVAP